MKISGRELPFWVIKTTGDDRGLYRITKVSSKYGADADMYIGSFALFYSTSNVIKVDRHFSYSTFQHFTGLEKANIDTKRNFIKAILKGIK